MRLLHDSRDTRFRDPCGAQPCGTRLMIRLRVEDETPDAVYLRLWFGKESFLPMTPAADDATLYETSVTLPESPCLLWYDFQVWQGGQFHWYGNAEDGLGGVGAAIYGSARSFQITAYHPGFTAPEWTRGAVFYQIFPDRFARGSAGAKLPMHEERLYHEDWRETPAIMTDPETGDNVAHDFYGGTLQGIRENLPYLQSLGVTALYLNPIFHARTNHRFDTIDWHAIDPTLGTEDDFRALCKDAQAMGIRLILDGVFSHAGSSNPQFLHAKSAQDSPYRNWFTFEHWPDMYKSWWGFTTLPELNKHQPEVIDFFLTDENAVVKRWLRDGASGWRLDVADELPMPFLKLLRRSTKATRADALILGEVWEDASNKVSYGELRNYCLGDTLDGVMNYPLREAAIEFLIGVIDANCFARKMASLYENYPAPFAQCLLNLLGSHDRARAINVLAGRSGEDLPREEQAKLRLTEDERALGIARMKLQLEITIAMPGMPCVYYGDEAGLEGSRDPFCRGTFPWGDEDQALIGYFRDALARRRTDVRLTDGMLAMAALSPDVLAVTRKGADGSAVTTVVNRGMCAATHVVSGREVTLAPLSCVILEDASV